MRRRKLLVALAALAVVVAAGVVVLWPSRLTRENYDRIQNGMSRTEVEAVLGPEGDYRTMPTKFVYLTQWYTGLGNFVVDDDYTPDGLWESDAGNICVIYRQGRVTAKAFVMTSRLDQSYLDNLLWRAQRQWHRWFPE
jgi:hypothetical protein